MTKPTPQPTSYLRYSSLIIVTFYGVIAGLMAIAAVLEAMTWSEVQDWLVKLGLVALILLAISLLIGFMVTMGSKRQ